MKWANILGGGVGNFCQRMSMSLHVDSRSRWDIYSNARVCRIFGRGKNRPPLFQLFVNPNSLFYSSGQMEKPPSPPPFFFFIYFLGKNKVGGGKNIMWAEDDGESAFGYLLYDE